MKDSELLRKAKRMMEASAEFPLAGVCDAIGEAAGTLQSEQVRSLKRWIKSMLGDSTWLFQWLRKEGHLSDHEVETIYDNKEVRAKLKQTRLNWIDWMIEYCEKEENERQ